MSNQDKRAARQKQEDEAFRRMLLCLAGCAVLEGLALLLRRFYIRFQWTDAGIEIAAGISAFFGVFRFAGVVLTTAGLVWLGLRVRQGWRGRQLLAPLVCTGAALWLTAAAVLTYGRNQIGMTLLMALPVVAAVLSLLFFLYQREFFYNAILCGAGITALWVYRQIFERHPTVTRLGFAAVWVFLGLAAFAVFQLDKRKGKFWGIQILSAGANRAPLYFSCVVTSAALLAALVTGAAASYYVMFVIIGWLFCLAVYYTVKLM